MLHPSTSGVFNGSSTVKFGVQMRSKPSRFSKPILSPAVSARRSVLKRIRRQELRRLRALLPSLRQRRQDDELAVVREAVRYIDQLHSTIMARLYSGSLSYDSVAERLHPFTMNEIQRRHIFITPQVNQSRFEVMRPFENTNRIGNRENRENNTQQRGERKCKMTL